MSDLLEQLVRPDNLSEAHLDNFARFAAEHRDKLADVEAATSSFSASAVADAAVRSSAGAARRARARGLTPHLARPCPPRPQTSRTPSSSPRRRRTASTL
jgi:hypothetical protein